MTPTNPHDDNDLGTAPDGAEEPFGDDTEGTEGNDPDSGSPLNPAAHDDLDEE